MLMNAKHPKTHVHRSARTFLVDSSVFVVKVTSALETNVLVWSFIRVLPFSFAKQWKLIYYVLPKLLTSVASPFIASEMFC